MGLMESMYNWIGGVVGVIPRMFLFLKYKNDT